MAEIPLVTGFLVISANFRTICGGTAYITLEDVTYADALAIDFAEVIIHDIHHITSNIETLVPFEIYLEAGDEIINSEKEYAVRVWLDCDSDGQMGIGDLISDQSCRVLTEGHSSNVSINLMQIG